ncbi:MAG: carotenoid biosynthesis protein [Myxococcus sp.]|nr:carotenoid biosynthesis protein [Myxococcus sp.]
MSANTGENQLPLSALGARELVLPYVRAGWRAMGDDVPAWLFFWNACLLLNTSLTNLSPARPDFAPTILFPMGVFVLFTTVRALKSPTVRFPRLALYVPVAMALGLPTLNLLFHTPSPLEVSTLRTVYELSNFLWAALLIRYFWQRQKSLLAFFFGVGLFYGAVLENGGIVLGFFDEQNLGATMVRPFVAPVATMIGWCVVLGMGTHLVWRLREWLPGLKQSALGSAVLVGVFATMLDLQIDPIATLTGCWVWHHSLPPWFHGVPQVNFVAWLCALIPFSWVMFRLQDKLGVADAGRWTPRQLGFGMLAVPYALVIALLAFMTTTAVLEGTTGPSWELLATFASKWLAAVGA